MKVAFAFLAVLALASPLYGYKLPASGSGALANELQKLVDLIPLEKVLAITRAYAAQDKEFKAVLGVFNNNSELKQLVQDVESNPVFQKLINTAEKLGLDIRTIINYYNGRIGVAPLAPLAASDVPISGGILGYVKDVGDVLPLQKMQELIDTDYKNSKVIHELAAALSAQENADFYWSIYRNQHFQNLKQQAANQGITGLLFQQFFPVLLWASCLI